MSRQTRGLYDAKTTKNRQAITQQPASYVLDHVNEHQLYRSAGSENIDNDSDLRMKPTRLNYFNRPETELYGTAPYKTLDHRHFVDVESGIRNGLDVNDYNKSLTEVQFPYKDFINDPLALDSGLRASSTRADLRNKYCAVSGRSHNMATHETKN